MNEQQKRVEEIRARHTPCLKSCDAIWLLDLLREKQAEVERETAVRKTAESEAHNHAIRTAELYIERERQQSELEALRKDREQFLRQRTEAWREAQSLRGALLKLAAASECLCTLRMEDGCCRCQALEVLAEEPQDAARAASEPQA